MRDESGWRYRSSSEAESPPMSGRVAPYYREVPAMVDPEFSEKSRLS